MEKFTTNLSYRELMIHEDEEEQVGDSDLSQQALTGKSLSANYEPMRTKANPGFRSRMKSYLGNSSSSRIIVLLLAIITGLVTIIVVGFVAFLLFGAHNPSPSQQTSAIDGKVPQNSEILHETPQPQPQPNAGANITTSSSPTTATMTQAQSHTPARASTTTANKPSHPTTPRRRRPTVSKETTTPSLPTSTAEPGVHYHKLASLNYDYSKERASFDCNATAECLKRAELMESYMNLNAAPCENFYEYACGNFPNFVSPSDITGYTENMGAMASELERTVLATLSDASSPLVVADAHRKARRYFKGCMTTMSSEERLTVIRSTLNKQGGFLLDSDTAPIPDFNETLARMLPFNLDSLFNVSFTNADVTLKEGSYETTFLSDFDDLAEKLQWPQISVDRIKQLERELRMLTTSGFLFDMDLFTTRITVNELQQKYNQIDWHRYFQSLSRLDSSRHFEISSVKLPWSGSSFLEAMNLYLSKKVLTVEGRRDLHNYLVLNTAVPFYSSAKDESNTDKKTACMYETIAVLPFAVGSMFENNATRVKTTNMLGELWKSVNKSFAESPNIGPSERRYLTKSMATLHYEIGFPVWTFNNTSLNEYHRSFEVTENNPLQNKMNAYQFQVLQSVKSLGIPAEDANWGRSVLDVNAIFVPNENKIYIFTGVLQKPIYDYNYIDAFNFGGIGTVLGHELNHLIGSNTGDDFLDNRETCVADYYSHFNYNDYSLNSRNTVKDDMADISGITASHAIFRSLPSTKQSALWNIKLPKSGSVLTADQAFFVMAGQNFCVSFTPSAMERLVQYNDHSPGPFRVNGAMAQTPAFAEAFKCPANSPMNPVPKCQMF